jgi:DNA-binding NtrC family response regulator
MQAHPLSSPAARSSTTSHLTPLTTTRETMPMHSCAQAFAVLSKVKTLSPLAQPGATSDLQQLAAENTCPKLRVLIVDDDLSVRKACAEIASSLGFLVQVADSAPSASATLAQGGIDLLLLDLKLPDGNHSNNGGLTLLEEVCTLYPGVIVMVMTAFASISSAVEVMRLGVRDYLTKPFTLKELSTVLEHAAKRRVFDIESRKLRDKLLIGKSNGNLIGHSPAMEKLYRILSKVAFRTHPVLILGETGTGKELVARSIHHNGSSAGKPFVPVDCGSLVPSMVESELFGHTKGAISGMQRAKPGLLASTHGGTLFLDEIGELPLDLQGRLLRALQEKQVRPVGSSDAAPITVRILAATNRDLAAMVESGLFRKDLFLSLNVVNLVIPPLRERKQDIPLLAANVLERMKRENGVPYNFGDEVLHQLMDYDWPGNVRELEHSIERACALSSGPVLRIIDLPTTMQNHRLSKMQQAQERSENNPEVRASTTAVRSIAELEKQAIIDTIRQLKGDKLMAARLLGIGKTTLYRKLKEYGLDDDRSLI